MPIEPPKLDDLQYDRIREELVRRIPVHAPEWTDHNESDPGITLIQLFAYLAEQVGYRLNRVPEKNHVELLKLLGVRLRTARAARTRLAFLLADPATAAGFLLAAGARATAAGAEEPPTFETDVDLDVVPAQPVALVSTRGEKLWDLLYGEPAPTSDELETEVTAEASPWHAVVWDGKKPKLKDMPLEPIELFPDPTHRYLWVGLSFNSALDAGFRGVRVTLHLQLDDDELPDLEAAELCDTPVSVEKGQEPVQWLHYFDAGDQKAKLLPGRIDDTTRELSRSGTVRFTVPFTLGPVPEALFADLREAVELSPGAACEGLRASLDSQLSSIAAPDPEVADSYKTYLTALQHALTDAVDESFDDAEPKPALPHPLDPALRDPAAVRSWLRLGPFDPPGEGGGRPQLRMLIFNAAAATHAETVTNELQGVADGRPGQRFQLGHGNVLAGSLEVAVQEEVDGPLVPWRAVDSLDPAGPFDRQVEVDLEAGALLFGDGRRGMIPPLAPGAGHVVAIRYRHGGGVAGETGVGTVTSLETQHVGIAGCANVVAAAGGADAETLEEAKVRARKELSTRNRAVTAGDFEWIAGQTPGVRVARVAVVPLRRPDTAPGPAVETVRCGGDLPAGPSGLDASLVAHGAVSVVVVPDEEGPEPIPTPSFLRAVCEHLNRHRLVTTEVYVVPPSYCRLCKFRVRVRGRAGYTRTRLQDLVEAGLARYLHVLTGGEDEDGFPFGGQVHVADLIARVFRSEGIERVEDLTCEFSRTRSNALPRQGILALCPTGAGTGEVEQIDLAPEETVSLDLETFTLTTVE